MPQEALILTGTRTELGGRLDRIFFSLPAYALYAALLGFALWRFMLHGDPSIVVIIGFLLLFSLHVVRCFIDRKLEDDETRPILLEDTASLLSSSIVRALGKRTTVNAGDLLAAALATERGRYMLQEMGLDRETVLKRCRDELEKTIDVVPFLQSTARQLPALGERVIDANVIVQMFFQYVPVCQKVLFEVDLSVDDLQGIVACEGFHHRFKLCVSSLHPDALRQAGTIGHSWVMGYTGALDWLTQEIPAQQQSYGEKSIVIHHETIDAILSVLARSSLRNVLVLGKVGVGKRTLVRNVACALRAQEQRAHQPFTRVLLLKTQQLLSGVKDPDAFLLKAFERAQHSGHFLIVVEDLPVFLKSANEQVKSVFLKFLQSKTISFIAIADTQDYHTLVKTDASLDSLFEKVTVDDAVDEDTMKVLMAHSFATATRKGITITYKAMKSILDLSKRYMGARGGFPGKALEVFDDVIVRVRQSGEKTVREDHVRDVITVRSRVNVQKVSQDERDRLLKLEEIMQRRVIGQDGAVRAVVNALKRARLDLSERKRPIGTFLFLGPTGVGKTQTAKVLAAEYFGSVDAIARLDMNEYSHENSLFGIIGAPSGSSGAQEGFLAQRLQDNPFTLILLDEIEKAHPKVLNLFLQILDEGIFNDARGVKTDFRNSIIIATSNAGALFVRDYIKEHADIQRDDFKKSLLDSILRDKIFSPEFVNRFDEIVLFTPLSVDNAIKVGSLMLGDIVGDVEKKRGIHVEIAEDVIKQLVERGYSAEFGARELRRTISDVLEDYLADFLLRNDVQRGQTITIRVEDLKK